MSELTPLHHTIAGASSGVVARLLGQPLDVLKIRYQLQNPTSNGTLKYSSIYSATRVIIKEEGVTALWKGHAPAQLLSVVYGSVQFSIYERCKKVLAADNSIIPSPVVSDFVCGGLGGLGASFACLPLDVIRTRFVAQTNEKVYKGLFDATKQMYREQGTSTFFKGYSPALVYIFPYAGLHFSFYGVFKDAWHRSMGNNTRSGDDQKIKRAVCGGMSGMCSKLILLPLDFVKKRLQVQGFVGTANQQYKGMYDCIRTVVVNDGIAMLYNGATPSVLKAAFVTGVTFLVYEESCDWMRKNLTRNKNDV